MQLGGRDGFARAKDPWLMQFARPPIGRLTGGVAETIAAHGACLGSSAVRCSRSPLDVLVDREQFQAVLDAIARLSSRSRDMVIMRFLEEQTYDEIGRALGKTPHQVRGLCHKALGRLRRMLGDEFHAL